MIVICKSELIKYNNSYIDVPTFTLSFSGILNYNDSVNRNSDDMVVQRTKDKHSENNYWKSARFAEFQTHCIIYLSI